jgi:hypothetical protein
MKHYLLAIALVCFGSLAHAEGGGVQGTPTGRPQRGTANAVAKYQANGQLGDSRISDSGSVVTVTGPLLSSATTLGDGSAAHLNGPDGTAGFIHEAFNQDAINLPSLGLWSAAGVRGSSTPVQAGTMAGIFVKGFDGVNPNSTTASKAQIAFIAEDAFRSGHTPININFVTQKGGSSGTTNRRTFAVLTSSGPFLIGNLGTAGASGFLDSGTTAQLQVTPDTGVLHAIQSNGHLRVDGELRLDRGTGAGQATLDGSAGGCIMLRDTDDAGWTECDALDGTLSCSTDADGLCD